MFHILIKKNCNDRSIIQTNLTIDSLIKITNKYNNNENFIIDGYQLNKNSVERFKIVESEIPMEKIIEEYDKNDPKDIIIHHNSEGIINGSEYVTDVTEKYLG